jgi:hypothetical protein
VGSWPVGRILFLGNSITLHGPAPSIGWTGDWGMAASTAERDHVHLLVERIAKAAGGRPRTMVRNIADFERQLDGFDLVEGLKRELAFEPELVILAIGENVAPLTTDADKDRFRAALERLVAELARHGQPRLVVRSSFWPDAEKDKILEQVCSGAGGLWVDIGALGRDESNFARSERRIEHAGVAGHPGDKGMLAIADALWSAIEKRSAETR